MGKEFIAVRVSKAFRSELKAAAAREGLTMPEMAVKVFQYYQQHGTTKPKATRRKKQVEDK